jgi:hypothetical protein
VAGVAAGVVVAADWPGNFAKCPGLGPGVFLCAESKGPSGAARAARIADPASDRCPNAINPSLSHRPFHGKNGAPDPSIQKIRGNFALSRFHFLNKAFPNPRNDQNDSRFRDPSVSDLASISRGLAESGNNKTWKRQEHATISATASKNSN